MLLNAMGRFESATASIGLKILLSDLVNQMNETKLKLIIEMLDDGFIEDDTDEYNETYSNIINNDIMDNDDFKVVKMYLTRELINRMCYDKHLLIPVKEILRTSRWGNNRYGRNGTSTALDNNMCLFDAEKYKDIQNFETVFIIGIGQNLVYKKLK